MCDAATLRVIDRLEADINNRIYQLEERIGAFNLEMLRIEFAEIRDEARAILVEVRAEHAITEEAATKAVIAADVAEGAAEEATEEATEAAEEATGEVADEVADEVTEALPALLEASEDEAPDRTPLFERKLFGGR